MNLSRVSSCNYLILITDRRLNVCCFNLNSSFFFLWFDVVARPIWPVNFEFVIVNHQLLVNWNREAGHHRARVKLLFTSPIRCLTCQEDVQTLQVLYIFSTFYEIQIRNIPPQQFSKSRNGPSKVRKKEKQKKNTIFTTSVHAQQVFDSCFFLCVCAAVVVHKIPSVVIKIQVKWRTHKKRAGKMWNSKKKERKRLKKLRERDTSSRRREGVMNYVKCIWLLTEPWETGVSHPSCIRCNASPTTSPKSLFCAYTPAWIGES